MNQLTVYEYLKNRENFLRKGRALEGNAAQKAARKEAVSKKLMNLCLVEWEVQELIHL